MVAGGVSLELVNKPVLTTKFDYFKPQINKMMLTRPRMAPWSKSSD